MGFTVATMNDTKTTKIETAKRVYSVVGVRGMWFATYQPRNPKTGKPWQASRHITLGHSAYRLTNWQTKADSGVLPGQIPAFEAWSKDWTGASSGFASESEAMAAVEAEIEKTGDAVNA